MADTESIREQIAAEAARLLLRGKENDFTAARKRAARWLKRRRLRRDEIPSAQEIQVQMYALSGLMASECRPMLRAQLRHGVTQVLQAVLPGEGVWLADVTDRELASGAVLQLVIRGPLIEVRRRLEDHGWTCFRTDDTPAPMAGAIEWQARLDHPVPCQLWGIPAESPLPEGEQFWTLTRLLAEEPAPAFEPADDEHPDAFAVFEMLMQPLEKVRWPSDIHPEGDALYHSLQVFELGVEQRPYDEEFLLACLLHDVGWGINPRHPVLSGIDALGTLITDRTRFLIEHRPVAGEYLRTGRGPKSLLRSEDFEDAVLLARCDREGRVPGAQVRSLDEAFDYIASLDTAWDDDANETTSDDVSD